MLWIHKQVSTSQTNCPSCLQSNVFHASTNIFSNLSSTIKSLTNDKLQFKGTLQRYITVHSFYLLDEFHANKQATIYNCKSFLISNNNTLEMYYDLVWLCINVFLHCGILIDFVCVVNLIQLSADRSWDPRNVCVSTRTRMLRGQAFSLRGLLFGYWATTENPGYIPLHSHHTNTSCCFCSWMGTTTQTLHSYMNC